MRKKCSSGPSLTCGGLARRSVVLGKDFQAHQGSLEALWTSFNPPRRLEPNSKYVFKLQAATELCLKGADQKPASEAAVWAATWQGAHAVRPQHRRQGVRREGDAEDTAAHPLRDEQAAVACLGMGPVWSAAPFRCCVAGSWDSHWHLGSSGLLKNDHCERHPH